MGFAGGGGLGCRGFGEVLRRDLALRAWDPGMEHGMEELGHVGVHDAWLHSEVLMRMTEPIIEGRRAPCTFSDDTPVALNKLGTIEDDVRQFAIVHMRKDNYCFQICENAIRGGLPCSIPPINANDRALQVM